MVLDTSRSSGARAVAGAALGLSVLLAACAAPPAPAGTPSELEARDPLESGGPLLPEQAAFDVLFYGLAVTVDPQARSIEGSVTTRARIGSPLARLVLDLDPRLAIRRVELVDGVSGDLSGDLSGDSSGGASGGAGEAAPLAYERRGGRVWIDLGGIRQPGEEVAVRIDYGGVPREAPRPPWRGGFTWARTASGAPWIATTCQAEGADIWWPVKDHVSDEPLSMTIDVTVPEPLVAASNGRLVSVEPAGPGMRTFHWAVSTPINTYDVALNIAPYETIEESFTSVAGDTFPVVFYVLPEDLEKGRRLFPEILEHLRFFERRLGPYPFRADKYGVAETPHLGMEHQTIIAYGGRFENTSMLRGTDWGFDVLHHHELSHEWWGNLVTNADWADMWLHEGLGTYMQALYVEEIAGAGRYRAYLESFRRWIRNREPVAPRRSRTADTGGTDVYYKAAWVLHTLRFLIGDEAMWTLLRRMAYPDPALEEVTDGGQCRFAVTGDFVRLASRVAGADLSWFFEVYLRRAALPELEVSRRPGAIELSWRSPGGLPFPMPIEIGIGDEVRRIEIPAEGATVAVPDGVEPVIDPSHRVLRALHAGPGA